MGVKVLNDNILVQIEQEDVVDIGRGAGMRTTTSGNIVIPDAAHESVMAIGRILGIGPGKWYDCKGKWIRPGIQGLKEGDRVLFIKFLQVTETAKATQRALEAGQFFMKPRDILGIVEDSLSAKQIVG